LIHPSAIIHPAARIGENVEVGPYTIIGKDVEIGEGSQIGSHVVISGPTRIGSHNHIYHHCSIGEDPQDKKYQGESESELVMGDHNTIREFCTINRGTASGGGTTRVGNQNWIMAYVHIAHDCIVGNNNTFANNTTLAGHVVIEDNVILGGFTGVHQFCHIGKHSFSAIASVITRDVPPFVLVSGNTAKPTGLNREGLKRQGMDANSMDMLRKAYRTLYQEGLLLKDALERLDILAVETPEVKAFVSFIRKSERGIVR
jgi:UDP-N-acetylglucosamine acyltransferase